MDMQKGEPRPRGHNTLEVAKVLTISTEGSPTGELLALALLRSTMFAKGSSHQFPLPALVTRLQGVKRYGRKKSHPGKLHVDWRWTGGTGGEKRKVRTWFRFSVP